MAITIEQIAEWLRASETEVVASGIMEFDSAYFECEQEMCRVLLADLLPAFQLAYNAGKSAGWREAKSTLNVCRCKPPKRAADGWTCRECHGVIE